MGLVWIFIHVRPLLVSPAYCLRIMTGKCQILWKLRVVLVIIERIVFDINHIWRLYIYSIDIHTCVVLSVWRNSFKRQVIWYLYLLFFIVVRCVGVCYPADLYLGVLCYCQDIWISETMEYWRPCFAQLSIQTADCNQACDCTYTYL